MKIVVDTNIVFSAILNTNSRIARIILQPRTRLNFYSTEQLLKEILEHKQKLQRLTDYTDYELDEDDIEFVALTDHLKGKLWSGDKELQNGLIKKKWNKFITTNDLFQLISKRRIGKK